MLYLETKQVAQSVRQELQADMLVIRKDLDITKNE
jgi:hypothetical protein